MAQCDQPGRIRSGGSGAQGAWPHRKAQTHGGPRTVTPNTFTQCTHQHGMHRGPRTPGVPFRWAGSHTQTHSKVKTTLPPSREKIFISGPQKQGRLSALMLPSHEQHLMDRPAVLLRRSVWGVVREGSGHDNDNDCREQGMLSQNAKRQAFQCAQDLFIYIGTPCTTASFARVNWPVFCFFLNNLNHVLSQRCH